MIWENRANSQQYICIYKSTSFLRHHSRKLKTYASKKKMATIWFLPLFFFTFLLFTAFKSKKKQQWPPSPPGFPIIGNLHQFGELPHQSLWRLSKKYGPVMFLKLGRLSTVVVSSSKTAKQALKIHLCCYKLFMVYSCYVVRHIL